ncbi:MAG: phosphorylase family protein [Limisphaerales bacterium]
MNAEGPILVCYAVPEEVRPLRRWARKRGRLHLLETGMGRRNAEATIEAWFSRVVPSIVISSGFAGGLNPTWRTGQVIHDFDPHFPWAHRLEASGAQSGRFFCADRIAVTRDEKRALREKTGAEAVEMESEPIRGFCRAQGVPSATIRVISDAADEDLPLDFNRLMGANWEMDYGRLALALAGSPGRMIELIRFQRRLRAAAESLATVLRRVIEG